MKENKGAFVISLDFELFWGIRDKYSLQQYGDNVMGVWRIVPEMLRLFSKYDVHATFATVGLMFNEDSKDLNNYIPSSYPKYTDKNLSPYNGYIQDLVKKQDREEYHYGISLIKKIKQDPRHEIGTHTYSHYYCLEEGQNKEEFDADLQMTVKIAKDKGIKIESLVFPRHQINRDYLKILLKNGISIYRETEKSWYNSPAKEGDESILKRAVRFADYYFYMGSNHCQSWKEVKQGDFYCIRASRWFRPYNKKWELMDWLKIARIKQQMKYAAKNGKIFHLWWHPHDFGINQEKNLKMLKEILEYYSELNKKYGMNSFNMKEVAQIIIENE